MDGAGDFLTRLRAALAAFDDALAALANKGLVRRARKDLETAAPRVLGAVGDRLQLEVADATVMIDPTPSRSTCSCPAGGICRHILAALIFLRDTKDEGRGAEALPRPTAPTVAPAGEILAIDEAALTKWAGKALVQRVLKTFAGGLSAEFDESGTIVARIPSRNATCRWMPGGGLAGMVCSCHAADACEHKVAMVLAFHESRGLPPLIAMEATLREASAGAARTREDVLSSVCGTVREMVALGTSRLSRATAERLRTLAVSAHGVDLPRLERLVRALADGVEQGLARAAQADAAGLLAQAARAEAFAHALGHRPTPTLIGEHRSSYTLVGDIEIAGVGARRWRARSGYAGLTVYFWDRSARRWASRTEARPLATGGDFDPAARYHDEGPWPGVVSPAEASRSVLRLTGAWRNRAGRLSGRPSTRALHLGPTDVAAIPGRVECWTDLIERARLLFGGGFRDRSKHGLRTVFLRVLRGLCGESERPPRLLIAFAGLVISRRETAA